MLNSMALSSDPGFRRRNRATVEENFATGKNPCAHQLGFVHFDALGAPIAQLDRASDYGSEGYRFNSYWVRHFLFFRLLRAPGSVLCKTPCRRVLPAHWQIAFLRAVELLGVTDGRQPQRLVSLGHRETNARF